MTSPPSRLRAMDVCDLLDRAVSLYRENLITLLGVYAVGYVPFWLLLGLSAHLLTGAFVRALSLSSFGEGGDQATIFGVLGVMVLAFVLFAAVLVVEPIVSGAMTCAVSDRILGRPASIGSSYVALRGRRAALVFASLIRLFALYGAVNLVSFPGVMLAGTAFDRASVVALIFAVVLHLLGLLVGALLFVYLLFIGQIIVIERLGIAEALSRSWRLVSGRLWRTSGIAGFLFLLVLALTMAFQAPLLGALALWGPAQGSPEATVILTALLLAATAIASLLASPVMVVGFTLMYFDLRVRREGLDVEMIASSLARGEAST